MRRLENIGVEMAVFVLVFMDLEMSTLVEAGESVC